MNGDSTENEDNELVRATWCDCDEELLALKLTT